MAMLGLRTCEVCGLNWDDIDLDNKTLHIQRNRVFIAGYGIETKGTKTHKQIKDSSNRVLPIFEPIYSKLVDYKKWWVELRDNEPDFDTSEAVFCNHLGKPRNPGYVDILLRRSLHEAGCKQVSPHKLRHTFITRLIGNNTAVNMVSAMVGHSKIDTTLKVYTQYVKDTGKEREALECLFNKKAEQPA